MKNTFLTVLLIMLSACAGAQELYQKQNNVSTRWASAENWKGDKGHGGIANYGRKGSPSFGLKAGENKILAEASGTSGIIRRIWITIENRAPEVLRGVKIEMYWDGASDPAVSAPLGDFFNQGLGQMASFENALFSSPEGRSFNCIIPMPFRKSMKIIVSNTSDKDITMFFYDVDYTLGDKTDENTLYFHARFNQQKETMLRNDFQVVPRISGSGRYLGANISVEANDKKYLKTWWGEGEIKIYLDGDKEFPTLCGTGTEDYIGTGWGLGEYNHMYQGCTVADEKDFKYAFYRYHIPDPVYFNTSLMVTLQQIGFAGEDGIDDLSHLKDTIYKAGKDLIPVDFSAKMTYLFFERSDNVSSCAYFYLDRP